MLVQILTEQKSAQNKDIFLLGNATFNQVLEHSNMYKKVQIASLTKLMTAYVCINKVNIGEISFSDKVFVSKNASEVEPSKAYLIENNFYSLNELFKTMLIKSANDCAIAIAEHISGSEKSFSELMNKTALELGMKSTFYANASGLNAPNQHSTAYDQYLLFQEIIKVDEIVLALKTPQILFNNGANEKMFYSTNKLVSSGIIGKTGYTIEAKNCFCGVNIEGDNKFIFVTLGNNTSEERFNIVQNSFNKAQSNYENKVILSNTVKNKKFNLADNELEYVNEQDFSVLIKKGEKCKFSVIEKFYSSNKFPIKQGEIVGESLILFNNRIIKKVNLVALNTVKRTTIISNIKRIVRI